MNKVSEKITVFTLCGAMCLANAPAAFGTEPVSDVESVVEAIETAGEVESVVEAVAQVESVVEAVSEVENVAEEPESAPADFTKDEIVYVLAGADGSVEKLIVSDWIKNTSGAASIEDRSELSDIENVKGDETWTADGETLVWDAQGNDIYYNGTIEKALPVNLTVTYLLDGAEVTAEEIEGKSGRVSICFDYENTQYETVLIGGAEEKIYVPFVALTGMLLDGDQFRNVEVTNGSMINDGDRTAVIGFALPGLKENLGIGEEELEIPDHVEITADVTDFSMGMSVTVVTNGLFGDLDASGIDSVINMMDSIEELTAGLEENGELSAEVEAALEESGAFSGEAEELLDKMDEILNGIEQLTSGAYALKDGAAQVDDGVGQVQDGTDQLSGGLGTLKENNDALTGGAKQVFETLLATAEAQIREGGIEVPALTIENYGKTLDAVVESLGEEVVSAQALEQVTAAVEANRPLIVEKVTAAVREQVEAEVTAAVREQVMAGVTQAVQAQVTEQVISQAAGMSLTDYEAAVSAGLVPEETQTAVAAAIEAQMQTEDVLAAIELNTAAELENEKPQAAIAVNTDAQMETEALQQTIAENVEAQVAQAITDNMASEEVQTKLAAAAAGAESLRSLKESLDSYNTFYQGLISYTEGVAAAADGASALATGVSDLKGGTVQLKDGAAALYDGIVEFETEISGSVGSLAERVKATIEVSRNYCNFSGIGEGMDGAVKFIYRMS